MNKFFAWNTLFFYITICTSCFSQSQNLLAYKSDFNIGQNFSIHSNILNENREVSIALPSDYYKSEKVYPVLYMLDGYFKMAVGTVGFLSEEAGLIPQ